MLVRVQRGDRAVTDFVRCDGGRGAASTCTNNTLKLVLRYRSSAHLAIKSNMTVKYIDIIVGILHSILLVSYKTGNYLLFSASREEFYSARERAGAKECEYRGPGELQTAAGGECPAPRFQETGDGEGDRDAPGGEEEAG